MKQTAPTIPPTRLQARDSGTPASCSHSTATEGIRKFTSAPAILNMDAKNRRIVLWS